MAPFSASIKKAAEKEPIAMRAAKCGACGSLPPAQNSIMP
jgi:hypothetical protein